MNLTMKYQAGSCVVCGQGTDTVIAFHGEAEWHIAGLRVLGVPEGEDVLAYEAATGSEPGTAPSGETTLQVRVCAACCARSPFHPRVRPALALPGQEVSTIRPMR